MHPPHPGVSSLLYCAPPYASSALRPSARLLSTAPLRTPPQHRAASAEGLCPFVHLLEVDEVVARALCTHAPLACLVWVVLEGQPARDDFCHWVLRPYGFFSLRFRVVLKGEPARGVYGPNSMVKFKGDDRGSDCQTATETQAVTVVPLDRRHTGPHQ